MLVILGENTKIPAEKTKAGALLANFKPEDLPMPEDLAISENEIAVLSDKEITILVLCWPMLSLDMGPWALLMNEPISQVTPLDHGRLPPAAILNDASQLYLYGLVRTYSE